MKFKDTQNIKKFDMEFLRSNCKLWLQNCITKLKLELENAFKYATNLKSLVLIRDSVIEFEANLVSNSKLFISDCNQHLSWNDICESLFSQKVKFWTELISPFYYSQSKVSLTFL